METFADYILNEKDYDKKLAIMYYLGYYLEKKMNKREEIFFDKSVIFKTQLAKMFIEQKNLDIDKNLVLTACLLCACKKTDNPQDFSRVKSYAKESAEYLETLGFSKRFCKICEEQNRYSGSEPREKESDILELVDQFGGMLLHRPERMGFKVDEALVLLEYRNLKDKNNIYLEKFKEFIDEMEKIKITDNNLGLVTNYQKEVNSIADRDNTKDTIDITLEVDKNSIKEIKRQEIIEKYNKIMAEEKLKEDKYTSINNYEKNETESEKKETSLFFDTETIEEANKKTQGDLGITLKGHSKERE